MNELALFAGAGGGILGGKLLGWRTVCAVEIEPYAASVLIQRQNDGILQPFPIWDDIISFDGNPWRGIVDVVSGGFPCQDISCAGKGKGIDGKRSGIWMEMARIISEVRPRFVFVENSPMLTSRGLGVVLGDLAEMGYNARWGVLGARHVGAPHKRDRIWIVGNSCDYGHVTAKEQESVNEGSHCSQTREVKACESQRPGTARINEDVADTNQEGLSQRILHPGISKNTELTDQGENTSLVNIAWWDEDPADEIHDPNVTGKQQGAIKVVENARKTSFSGGSGFENRSSIKPFVGRVAHGVANRVDRLKAIGNGQVPAVAKLAWEILNNLDTPTNP